MGIWEASGIVHVHQVLHVFFETQDKSNQDQRETLFVFPRPPPSYYSRFPVASCSGICSEILDVQGKVARLHGQVGFVGVLEFADSQTNRVDTSRVHWRRVHYGPAAPGCNKVCPGQPDGGPLGAWLARWELKVLLIARAAPRIWVIFQADLEAVLPIAAIGPYLELQAGVIPQTGRIARGWRRAHGREAASLDPDRACEPGKGWSRRRGSCGRRGRRDEGQRSRRSAAHDIVVQLMEEGHGRRRVEAMQEEREEALR